MATIHDRSRSRNFTKPDRRPSAEASDAGGINLIAIFSLWFGERVLTWEGQGGGAGVLEDVVFGDEFDGDSMFAMVGEALANGDEVRIAGYETSAARIRPARTGRNSRTGETTSISASKSPSFKAEKTLRDAVNAGRNP